MIIIRAAVNEDIESCVALVEARRRRYELYQPKFWRKSENSALISSEWYGQLFENPDVISLVAEIDGKIDGFLIASSVPAPPVYNPGGPNAIIDDFAVKPGGWMEIGSHLLSKAKKVLKDRGFAQLVVVGARQDIEKTEFLEASNLSLASTWWTMGL